MIIAKIDTFPLRIPFKPGIQVAASAWGDEGLPVADSLLVGVTTDQVLLPRSVSGHLVNEPLPSSRQIFKFGKVR